jgi:crotonobetainyl-CoA:carnitine CoA-transferase CaiB-like acyl-CoA transferase
MCWSYNVRPQAMARLGLGYDVVRAVNPKLIYVGAYGYSQRGPYAAKAAYDDLIQGASGIPALSLQQGADAPHYAPVNLADRLTGLHTVYAVTAALFHRERSGEGQAVEVPMFESVAHFVLGDHTAGLTFEPPSGEPGYARLLARRPYATADGYLCVPDLQRQAMAQLLRCDRPAADDVRPPLCHAIEPREQHRRNLRRAVRAHEDAQHPQIGWRCSKKPTFRWRG